MECYTTPLLCGSHMDEGAAVVGYQNGGMKIWLLWLLGEFVNGRSPSSEAPLSSDSSNTPSRPPLLKEKASRGQRRQQLFHDAWLKLA
jgi:hypothetical protein